MHLKDMQIKEACDNADHGVDNSRLSPSSEGLLDSSWGWRAERPSPLINKSPFPSKAERH